jgi:DNA polymerase-3 subunit gamma/tau
MSQALYRKWRPQTWDEVIGQDHVIQTLHNSLNAGRVTHAYLFAGPRGTGKTTTARLLAKAVNCLEPDLTLRPCGQCDHCQAINQGRFLDLIEIDAASNTSVDDVRDLRNKINFSPNTARYKVYIIDEVHMLSTAAFNALLKTLEEPPPHAIFVLATTEVHKIPATVLSRCQRHEFRRIPVDEIVAHLNTVIQGEEYQVEKEALTLIARQSTGSMRDAISLLDQLASTGQTITLDMTQTILGTATSQSVLNIVDSIISKQAADGMNNLHKTFDAGSDPRQFARQIVDYLRDLLIIHMGNIDQIDASTEMLEVMTGHTQSFTTSELLQIIRIFNRAAFRARNAWQPALPLEMALVESIEISPSVENLPQETQLKNSPHNRTQENPTKYSSDVSSSSINPEQDTTAGETDAETSPKDRQETQNLDQVWTKILAMLRVENPNTYGLLNSAKSKYIKGDELILSFSGDVLKDKMEKKGNIKAVEQVLSQIFQKEIFVRCKVDITRRDEIPVGVDEDGMVAAAVRDLGGEVVDIQ